MPLTTSSAGDSRKKLGDAGERLAAARLTAQGYRIVDTKWRRRAGELDIVAWDGAVLVFVEVRTRRGDVSGTPEESVSPAKQRILWRLAELYLAEAGMTDDPPECRFDVVAIQLDPATGSVARFEILRGVVDGSA